MPGLFQLLSWLSHGCQTVLERAHSTDTETSAFYAHVDHCRPCWLWPEAVLGTLWSQLAQHQLHLHCWWTRVQVCFMFPSVGWRDLWYLLHRSVTRINLMHVWLILSVYCGTWVFSSILPMVTMWADWLWTHYLIFVFTVILDFIFLIKFCWSIVASPVALVVKNLIVNTGDLRDMGLIPGSGRSPGEGHGNPLQNSCLENPHGQKSLLVHRVTESDPIEVI